MEAGAPRDYPPPPMPRPPGRTQTVIAFVLAAIAVIFLPMVLGPLATGIGVAGLRKGDALGKWSVLAGVAATVLGLILVAAVNGER